MSIADPKKYAQRAKEADDEDDDLTMGEKLAAMQVQLEALIAQKSGGMDDSRLEAILNRVAKMSADAHERAANPSNKTHPGISVFSYPEGDRARPRPEFKCEMYWVGYPLEMDTTTVDELFLLNQAEPGVYKFKRTDHTPTKPSIDTLTVESDRTPDGHISKLMFTFPVTERRETLPSMVDMLRTAFGIKSPEQMELDALRAEVARLKTTEAVGA